MPPDWTKPLPFGVQLDPSAETYVTFNPVTCHSRPLQTTAKSSPFPAVAGVVQFTPSG